jgi:hypothetical protein
MERVYLQWTVENWVTVLLMTATGLFVVGMISSAVRHYKGTAQVGGS